MNLSFLVPYLGCTFLLLLLAVAIACFMDWLESRKRMRGIRVRFVARDEMSEKRRAAREQLAALKQVQKGKSRAATRL